MLLEHVEYCCADCSAMRALQRVMRVTDHLYVHGVYIDAPERVGIEWQRRAWAVQSARCIPRRVRQSESQSAAK